MTTERHPRMLSAAERLSSVPSLQRLPWAVLRTLAGDLRTGKLTVIGPSGACVAAMQGEAGPEATLTLHRWRALRRLLFGGDVAFAEAYMDGDWSSPDLAALIELAVLNGDVLHHALSGFLPARILNRLHHAIRRNSKRGSRRNITAHYDLGNAFYALWLDRGMSYSSGVYVRAGESLDAAQATKQDRVVAALALTGGEHVLEIGCGWGGLAERLARQGCRVTGITLSPAQLAYATERIGAAGLSDRVDLRLQDYRDVEGRFDRIVSIEMIEAVGQDYWPRYFATLRDRLSPGGLALLQAITISDDRFPFYSRTPDFIQRYIFPGGMLPSPEALRRESQAAGLAIRTCLTFGSSYAKTLADWQRRFQAAWPDIRALGYDAAFKRAWEYYLGYCEGGFRSGQTDVGLYRLVHAASPNDGP